MDPVTIQFVVALPGEWEVTEMLQEMQSKAPITVSASARAELERLIADAAGQKPRIYVSGFG